MWITVTSECVQMTIAKNSHTLDAASKSYNQIKRNKRKDEKDKSVNARLARKGVLGLCLREGTRATARQTQMFPNRFATRAGHSTVVCTTLDKVLERDALKSSSNDSSMLRAYEGSIIDGFGGICNRFVQETCQLPGCSSDSPMIKDGGTETITIV